MKELTPELIELIRIATTPLGCVGGSFSKTQQLAKEINDARIKIRQLLKLDEMF